MKINRETFLTKLQSVQPGVTAKDKIDQSSCFVFQQGIVYTFDDEICCKTSSGLDEDFSGAVPAKKLIELLEKLPEDEVELNEENNELLVTGKKRKAGLRLEKEILLSIDSVDEPKKWRKLPPDEFAEATAIVAACAGTDDARFSLTCVHFHPEYLEACDNFQLTRYALRLGIEKPFLVRQKSIKHVTSLGMTEFGETKAWLHFRNPSGLVLSCRRFLEEFPDLSTILEVHGKPLTLPGGLAEAVQRAAIFSAEAIDDDKVMVELRPGVMKVAGYGSLGWFQERKKLVYDGPPLAFLIAPALLVEITKKHNSCQVSPDRLKVNGGKYHYVSCLSKVKEARSDMQAEAVSPANEQQEEPVDVRRNGKHKKERKHQKASVKE